MKTKSRIKYTFLLFLLVVFISEFSVRLILDTPSLSVLEKTHLRMFYGKNYEKLLRPKQDIYHSISELEYDPDSLKYRINNHGFRGNDFKLKKEEGEIRIVIIGGSHVFDIHGTSQNGGSVFTEKLEQNLRKNKFKVRIINAGIPGQSLKNIVLRMKGDIRKLKPDYILLNSTHNDIRWINYTDTSNFGKTISDITNVPREKLGVNPFIEKYNWLDHVLGFSKVYLQFRNIYWNNRAVSFFQEYSTQMKGKNYQVGVSQYEVLVNEFIHLSQEMGAQPILCLEEHFLSSKSTIGENNANFQMRYVDNSMVKHSTILRTYRDCDSILTNAAKEHQTPLIDIVERFSNRKDLFKDLIHTSEKGSLLMGQLYARELDSILTPSLERIP